jgi:hypothetical protein
VLQNSHTTFKFFHMWSRKFIYKFLVTFFKSSANSWTFCIVCQNIPQILILHTLLMNGKQRHGVVLDKVVDKQRLFKTEMLRELVRVIITITRYYFREKLVFGSLTEATVRFASPTHTEETCHILL